MTIIIRSHAQRYYKLLNDEWKNRTDLTEEVNLVLKRIDNNLTKLPEAIRQTHSKIITGLQIKSKDKLLSLFGDSAHVVKRGKAYVEVSNTLFISEHSDGFIID